MSEPNEPILSKVREALEKADNFEVWFHDSIFPSSEVKFDSEYLEFSANSVSKNIDRTLRGKLVEAFFSDVEKGGEMMRCFIPHHGIKAEFENTSVEIAICFMCSLFRGQISGQTFGGDFPGEELSESKKIFDEIIEKYGVDVR